MITKNNKSYGLRSVYFLLGSAAFTRLRTSTVLLASGSSTKIFHVYINQPEELHIVDVSDLIRSISYGLNFKIALKREFPNIGLNSRHLVTS
jgi:hypothetical protein